MKTESYNYNSISFQGRYKSLNALNPISYYTNKYFRKSANISQKNIEQISPELAQKLSIRCTKNGKHLINIHDYNPGNAKNYVVFLHGMAQNITNYQPLYKSILNQDIGVWAIEYRSYGVNKTTRISENKLRSDIEKGYQHLLKTKNIKPENVIIIGHSMGGALAANFATKHKDIKSLILISPLYNAANLGKKFMEHPRLGEGIPKRLISLTNKIKPLKWLYSLRFSTVNKLKNIKTPTYILQSKNDSVTPIVPARLLAKTARKHGILGHFITFPTGGHKVDNEKIEAISNILETFVK